MWGDKANTGYARAKFDTSSHSQLAAQTKVRVSFNCEVRANRKGPNPGYRTEREIFGSSETAHHKPKPRVQRTPSMQLTPFGASPSKPSVKPKVTAEQKQCYERLAAFHKKGNMTAIRTASVAFGKSAGQGAGY